MEKIFIRYGWDVALGIKAKLCWSSRFSVSLVSEDKLKLELQHSSISHINLEVEKHYGSLKPAFDMNKPKIIAYLKPSCGWSQGVRAIMKKYDLPFEDRDIINDPVQRQEMIEKSGQMLSPCVEINGHMLPDISGEEVEAWMLANQVAAPNDRSPDAPTNQPCAHELPQAEPMNFGIRQ